MNKVRKVVATRSFEKAVKKLQKDHKTKVLQEIYDIVKELMSFNITKQTSNHPLKNSEGHNDIHIDGGNLILIYRYDTSDDNDTVLIIDLRLQDVVDHKQLNNYSKYNAPAKDYDIDNITSSIDFTTWYDSWPEEDQWEIDDLADTEGIPSYEEASEEALRWLMDTFEKNRIGRYIRSDSEEDELTDVDQEFSSKSTAINGKQGKLPAIFKMINIPDGALVLDYGGGDEAAEVVAQNYLDQFNATELIYDKYNQTSEHNSEVAKQCRNNGGADIAICSNVLNVIKEESARLNVLQNIKRLAKPDGNIYITVYEGSGKGEGAPTQKNASYQNNRKTQDYLEEIQQVFPDAKRKGKLISATNRSQVNASIDLDAYDEGYVEMRDGEPNFIYDDYESANRGVSYSKMGDVEYGLGDHIYEIKHWRDGQLNDIEAASYGGAFDIEDDQFFTKEEITEFGNKVAEKFSSLVGADWHLSDVYMNSTTALHIEITNNDIDLYADINIDMRKIKKPSDIDKYVDDVIQKLKSSYDEYDYVESSTDITEDTNMDGVYGSETGTIQVPTFEDYIEFELDGIYVWVDEDGSIEFREDGRYPDWGEDVEAYVHDYGTDDIVIAEDYEIVDNTGEVLEPLMPRDPGKYQVYGTVTLYYDISGLLEVQSYYDGYEVPDIEYDSRRMNAKFNFRNSGVTDFSYAEA